jgi:hypothetical protein
MRKIYISGAISGLEEQATRKRFEEAKQRWQALGFPVINPFDLYDEAKNYYASEPIAWGKIMRLDLKALEGCQIIYMLKGWENSPGGRIERDFAVRLGLEVIYE